MYRTRINCNHAPASASNHNTHTRKEGTNADECTEPELAVFASVRRHRWRALWPLPKASGERVNMWEVEHG
jgi:hypothetical protein